MTLYLIKYMTVLNISIIANLYCKTFSYDQKQSQCSRIKKTSRSWLHYLNIFCNDSAIRYQFKAMYYYLS
jgi:hypothetical protein